MMLSPGIEPITTGALDQSLNHSSREPVIGEKPQRHALIPGLGSDFSLGEIKLGGL